MKVFACIPARYGSTRFAGKVLARETGKYLIQHTYEQALKARLIDGVIIAADDERVVEACRSFGAECVLTRADHRSGTDRIAEAVSKVDADIIVNVQGDEPEIEPGCIDAVAELLIRRADCEMATLASRFERREDVGNANMVKVVTDAGGRAIYFSRSVIPYYRDGGGIGEAGDYLRHIGIYAYRKEFLGRITRMAQTPLEKAESLEQLRAIENGFGIAVEIVEHFAAGVDTAEQYAEFVKRYKAKGLDQ